MSATKYVTDQSGRNYASVILTGKSNHRVWAYTMAEHIKSAKLSDLIISVSGVKDEATSEELKQQKILHCTTAKNTFLVTF